MWLLPAVALLVVVALGAWLILRRGDRPSAPVAADEPTQAGKAPRPALPPPARPRAKQETPDARKPRPLEYASDGVPYMPPGPDDPHPNTFAHPHPITPEHKRIFRENALLYQLNEAMDGRELSRLRGHLKEYREEYPDDPHDMQRGYALIADCIEHPEDKTIRAAAQRYFDQEIASTLRRFVLRHCLQPQN